MERLSRVDSATGRAFRALTAENPILARSTRPLAPVVDRSKKPLDSSYDTCSAQLVQFRFDLAKQHPKWPRERRIVVELRRELFQRGMLVEKAAAKDAVALGWPIPENKTKRLHALFARLLKPVATMTFLTTTATPRIQICFGLTKPSFQ